MINPIRLVVDAVRRFKALSSVESYSGGGWFGIIREAWGGAWQANIALDAPRSILAFSAVYSCTTLISSDVAKCCIDLIEEGPDGVEVEVQDSPFLRPLIKPNQYQTRLQFVEQWVTQKLLHGNAYVLKERDRRGMVSAFHVLDSQRVQTLVAENGDVFYEIARDDLAGVPGKILIPAREMVHDRMVCLFHPLVGVSPIYACATSATMGNKIQANSLRVFKNMSRPSGHLTAPGKIDAETATRMKKEFEENYAGENLGRMMVTGAGLEYKPMASVSAMDAQLIEQLKFTVEDVARAFHVPLFKLGGEVPRGSTIELLNLIYYTDCLQTIVESLELCLDDGLELPSTYHTEIDLDDLLRMDQSSLVKAEGEAVKAGIKTPNEARRKLNLKPVDGGDSPYLQEQNFSLAALAKRDAQADPFASNAPPAPAPQDPGAKAMTELFGEIVLERLRGALVALPAPAPAPGEEDADFALLVSEITDGLHVAAS